MSKNIEYKQRKVNVFMKILWGFTLLFAFLVLMSFPVNAQSQQYIKIPLDPAYSEKIGPIGTDFLIVMDNFNFTKIISATVNFNVFVKADTTFFAQVDGKDCLSPKFFVQGGSSQAISFDCSNILNDIGKYIITITADNPVPSAFGWAEVSYFSPPIDVCPVIPACPEIPACPAVPDVKSSVTTALVDYRKIAPASMHFSGTDYYSGETATVFVQLLDANNVAINNASCNFNMYNATNPLSPLIYTNHPMVFRGGNGIYYYQFSLNGLPTGTYPLDASCTYVFDNYYYYQGVTQSINVTTNAGTFQGGSPATLNAYDDSLYMGWTSQPNITFRWDNVTTSGNITQMELYWLGEYSAIRTLTFYAYNYTSSSYNIILGTKVTTSGGGTTVPNGLDEIFSAVVPPAAYNGTTISVIMTSSGVGNLYINWMTLKAYKNSSYISDVKGSSEVHIFMNMTGIYANATATQVWNYTPSRTLTDYNNTEIVGLLKGMANLTASDVWIFQNRTLSFFNYTQQALFNWNATNRNLTYYQTANISNLTVNVNASDIANQVWNNSVRTLTDYNNTEILNLVNGINTSVSQIGNWTLTMTIEIPVSFNATQDMIKQVNATVNRIENNTIVINSTVNSINTTANSINTYLINTIYPLLVTMNSTINSIQGTLNTVANNVISILGLSNQIYNNTMEINTTGYTILNQIVQINNSINSIPQAVWNATNRNLTYYQPVNATTIWEYPVRNLSFFDYQTQALFNWNATNRNLTFYPTTSVNTTDISQAVWNYTGLGGRTLTDYNMTQLLAYLVQINATTIQIGNTTNDTYNLLVAINGSLVPNTVYIW